MKTITRKEQEKVNLSRRSLALAVVKKTSDSNFYLGKRAFDKPRANPKKQEVLERLNR